MLKTFKNELNPHYLELCENHMNTKQYLTGLKDEYNRRDNKYGMKNKAIAVDDIPQDQPKEENSDSEPEEFDPNAL